MGFTSVSCRTRADLELVMLGSKSTSTSLRVMTYVKFVPQDTGLHLSSDRLELNEDAADHETMVSCVLRKCRWF